MNQATRILSWVVASLVTLSAPIEGIGDASIKMKNRLTKEFVQQRPQLRLSLRLQKCIADLSASDTDGDLKVSSEEFVGFISARSAGAIDAEGYTNLPFSLISNYIYGACYCSLVTDDPSCCVGPDAGIDLDVEKYPEIQDNLVTVCRNVDTAIGIELATPSPTKSKTDAPSKKPVDPPTVAPTKTSTTDPTLAPVAATSDPTANPTASPTVAPIAATNEPTANPTASPTIAPVTATSDPTASPTASPTLAPVAATSDPTASPTASPTLAPVAATSDPTANPTASPSIAPVAATSDPTASPTASPTIAPVAATNEPTASPTASPTLAPIAATNEPTASPTASPTLAPVAATSDPTASPTASPTVTPTASPTLAPVAATSEPTATPTASPTLAPIAATSDPTASPTEGPLPDLVCLSFQYGVESEDGFSAEDIELGRNNTIKSDLIDATRDIVIDILNETVAEGRTKGLRRKKSVYPGWKSSKDLVGVIKIGGSENHQRERRRTAFLPTKTTLHDRRLVFYSDRFPPTISDVFDNPFCGAASDGVTRCSIVDTRVCVVPEEGDDAAEIRQQLIGGISAAFRDGRFENLLG